MKKKTIIMSVILLFIIVFGISKMQNNQNETSPFNLEKENNTNVDEKNANEPSEIENNIEEEPETPAAHLTKEFTNALQNTIKFFSGKNTQIVAIGDSLTQGVGDSTGQGGYVGILDKHLNQDKKIATFENFGKRGNRTSQLLKRIEDPDIKKSLNDADIILITIGANDIMQVVKENFTDITYDVFAEERVHYEERLRKIFSTMTTLNPDAPIYLIGFYNPFQQYFEHIEELDLIVDDWNNTSKKVSKEYGVTFIPTKDLFMNDEINLFAGDHFHPNEYGYQLIAERVLDYLVVD